MMNQQNQSKTNRCISNNGELHSDFRILKIRKSHNHRLSVVDGGINKFGPKNHMTLHRVNKENKQPLNVETKKELKKKTDFQKKKPTFKVGIPHHKFWSPTAKDTPISHFHGLDKGYKIRPSLSRRVSQVTVNQFDTEKQLITHIESVNHFTANSSVEIKKETVDQEVLKERNVIDEIEQKYESVEENNIPDVDLMNVDDSEFQVKFLDVILLPATIMIFSIIIRFIFRINNLIYSCFF